MHSICATLNELHGDHVAGTYLAGSDLAVALLEEGSSRRQPRFENLLARVAIKAIDIAKPGLQIQLADVYEPRLQPIYEEEIGLRLTGGDRTRTLGAWNCLLRLVASDIPWAVRLADENWPRGQEDQICILQTVAEPTKSVWVADKLLGLWPSTSVTTLTELIQSEPRRHWLEDHVVETEQEAALSVLQSRMRHPVVNVLKTGVSYGPIVRLSGGRKDESLQRLRHVESWHPSWYIYKYCGEFLEAPSKESLASSLTSLASIVFGEGYIATGFGRLNIPWPIVACLNSCTNTQELIRLADRAAQGELGDAKDWIAAETRWFDNGITRDDLLSMTDDRLPIDARMRETGFPTTISTLGTIIDPRGSRGKLEEVLEVFLDIRNSKTRSFVATTINWLILAHYLVRRSDPASALPHLDAQTLKAVYLSVPSGSPVPLHMLVNFAGKSVQEIAEFCEVMKEKSFRFDAENSHPDVIREVVRVLRRAYMGLKENVAILPILAAAAEHGHLADQNVELEDPKLLETPKEKLAAFIVTLSQEKWHSDNSDQLIVMAQESGELSGGDFNRIVTTLSSNMGSGEHVDRFVVALKRLVPLDDNLAHQHYVRLLEDVLRRRTSQFADSNQSSRFAFPTGIIELLRE